MNNAVIPISTQSQTLVTADDLAILRNSKFRGFELHEMQYAAKVCNLLNLSPFLNQIHFTKRQNKRDGTWSIVAQVGIDGFRLTAQRAGGYAGSDEPIFEYLENDKGKKHPYKATVTVYKMIEGQRCPFTASARWEEYYPTYNASMWDKMPHNQLAKCAEALALRKAFPAELSSVYSDEEMDQAGPTAQTDATVSTMGKHPEPGDGFEPTNQGYRVPFGKFAKRSLDEIDVGELRNYINYLETDAQKKGKPLTATVQEFIEIASAHIAAIEGAPIG